jgi:hypothetical protein
LYQKARQVASPVLPALCSKKEFPMTEEKFWQIIQSAHEQSNGEMDSKCEIVKTLIHNLTNEEVTTFSHIFDSKMDQAFTWPLWGAAYVITGGCGDDSFTDFRASLISRGQKSYEQAVSNPDSLAGQEYDEDVWYYEGFQYAITESVESVVGSVPQRVSPAPSEPSGSPWEDDPEELKLKYPKLWLAFEHIWSTPQQETPPNKKPWWKFW